LFSSILLALLPLSQVQPDIQTTVLRGETSLSLGGSAFHRTRSQVQDVRALRVPGSSLIVATWKEREEPHYAIFKNGARADAVTPTQFDLKLRYQEFDPLVAVPRPISQLQADERNEIYIVQFITQAMDEYRGAIEAAGGQISFYMPHHAYLVRMSPQARAQVEQMPFVRWVGPYEPAYRLDPNVRAQLEAGTLETERYNLLVFDFGPRQKRQMADYIRMIGGVVEGYENLGHLMSVTLTPVQLVQVLKQNEVFWVDRWGGPGEPDMDIVRQIGGANYIEGLEQFRGQGVRAQARDTGVRQTHVDFTGRITVRRNTTSTSHGTQVFGIVFGNGTAQAQGRGLMPEAHGIFISGWDSNGRFQETADALQAPHFAVLETNSGGGTLTGSYTSDSFLMDDILFRNNIVILQSMSNWGTNTQVRPQAWAKNIVSIGGVKHKNTLTKADDDWTNGASIGPAADGRIKPNLTHFYDSVWAPSSGSDTSYANFSGTSSATPCTAGHFGLFFQMWHEGVFGNTVTGSTVFASRPWATTARAVMFNTASPYPFTGTTADLSRVKQGWGLADLKNAYDARRQMFIVNEEDVLLNLQTKTYRFFVPAGQPDLRTTMIYLDPPGTTSSSLHRINVVTLKVTAPNGTVYHGNNGLLAGVWSTPGGSPNTIDVEQNVFVQNPASGVWTVEVHAAQVNQDARLETPGVLDVDYALVVTGAAPNIIPTSFAAWPGSHVGGVLADVERSNNRRMVFRSVPEVSRGEQLRVDFEGTAATAQTGSLKLRVESSIGGSGMQRFFMYDFTINDWVLVGTHNVSVADTVATFDLPNPSRFVHSTTRAVRTRIVYTGTEMNAKNWTANIDQVWWIHAP
jgi:hypothetical protein